MIVLSVVYLNCLFWNRFLKYSLCICKDWFHPVGSTCSFFVRKCTSLFHSCDSDKLRFAASMSSSPHWPTHSLCDSSLASSLYLISSVICVLACKTQRMLPNCLSRFFMYSAAFSHRKFSFIICLLFLLSPYFNMYSLFQFIWPLPEVFSLTQAYVQLSVRCFNVFNLFNAVWGTGASNSFYPPRFQRCSGYRLFLILTFK